VQPNGRIRDQMKMKLRVVMIVSVCASVNAEERKGDMTGNRCN